MSKLINTVYLNNELRLSIVTNKAYNKQAIETSASVGRVSFIDGIEYWTHTIFKDYAQRISLNPCKRVTSKAKQKQHDEIIFKKFAEIVYDAKNFYGIKV
jgi:hypothetical protein